MSDQINSLLTKNMVSSSSSSSSNQSKRQVLRVRPNESPTFNAVMAVMCTSFTCLLLWMTVDNIIYNPDPDPVFRLLISYSSVFLASIFFYLALLACRNLVRKLDLQKYAILSPREGTKWPILNTTVAVTYAAISLYLLWIAIDGSLCEVTLNSLLGIKSPTALNIMTAKLSMLCASSYFCYLAILAFGEIICKKNLKHPKSDFESQSQSLNDSEGVLSASEVPAAMV